MAQDPHWGGHRRSLATRFGWKIGDRVPLTSPIWPNKSGGAWEFDVVGIYDGVKKTADTSSFLFRYDYFDEARQYGTGLIGWYQVRVDDPKRATAVAAAIDAEFANSPAETKAETEGAMFGGFAHQIGDVGTIVSAILGPCFHHPAGRRQHGAVRANERRNWECSRRWAFQRTRARRGAG